MELSVLDQGGNITSKIEVDDSVFKVTPNEEAVHRAMVAEMTNARTGTHSTKTRSEVRGGGRKPWRQKGTGRARAGTTSSPIWRGGGVIFGPKPKSYEKKLPKKMRRLARKSVLSKRVSDKAVMVIDSVKLEEVKTKKFVEDLEKLGINDKKITFLPAELDKNVLLSSQNLPNVFVVQAESASTYDLLDCEVILFDKEGIQRLNSQLAVS